MWAGWISVHVLLALWIVTAVCLGLLLADPAFPRRQLWNANGLGSVTRVVLGRFVPLALLLFALTWYFRPDLLFGFARRRPGLWALVMVLYPVFSVYPQGIVYRVFLFHRYRALLPGAWARIAASSLTFGYMHIVFGNWVAPALTAAGGVLFAWTYQRTGSALAAALEHALYGCYIITLGLGGFVYWAGG